MSNQQKPTQTPESRQMGWSMIVTAICLILFSLFLPTTPNKSRPYSEFINQVESDRAGCQVRSQHLDSVRNGETAATIPWLRGAATWLEASLNRISAYPELRSIINTFAI